MAASELLDVISISKTTLQSFAKSPFAELKTTGEVWREDNVLSFAVDPESNIVEILSYCMLAAQERCTNKTETIVPLLYLDGGSEGADGLTRIIVSQGLKYNGVIYPLGNLTMVRRSTVVEVSSSLIPPTAKLYAPQEGWFEEAKSVHVVCDQLADNPREFPIFFCKQHNIDGILGMKRSDGKLFIHDDI